MTESKKKKKKAEASVREKAEASVREKAESRAREKAEARARVEDEKARRAEEARKNVLVAVLDDNGHLVGTRRGKSDSDDVVLPDDCDLPLNGTYKWVEDQKCFLPLGTGFPRVATKPPVSETQVLYLIASAIGEELLPKEVRDWMRWYETNLKKREEELQVRTRKMRE